MCFIGFRGFVYARSAQITGDVKYSGRIENQKGGFVALPASSVSCTKQDSLMTTASQSRRLNDIFADLGRRSESILAPCQAIRICPRLIGLGPPTASTLSQIFESPLAPCAPRRSRLSNSGNFSGWQFITDRFIFFCEAGCGRSRRRPRYWKPASVRRKRAPCHGYRQFTRP